VQAKTPWNGCWHTTTDLDFGNATFRKYCGDPMLGELRVDSSNIRRGDLLGEQHFVEHA
jgi:hypothetical protein